VRIAPQIVVKFGPDVEEAEAILMEYVDGRCPRVRAPKLLGMLTDTRLAYIFMSFVEGETLEAVWTGLSPRQKGHLRDQLDVMLTDLHQQRPPEGALLGTLAPPHVCKDARRWIRKAENIENEAAFNLFLIRDPLPNIASTYLQWLRSRMRDDHRIVLSHGDLHPTNILVQVEGESVCISGLIDWEMGGWYPEYWDALKALNIRATNDESDWWLYMPKQLDGFTAEIALDGIVERTITGS